MRCPGHYDSLWNHTHAQCGTLWLVLLLVGCMSRSWVKVTTRQHLIHRATAGGLPQACELCDPSRRLLMSFHAQPKRLASPVDKKSATVGGWRGTPQWLLARARSRATRAHPRASHAQSCFFSFVPEELRGWMHHVATFLTNGGLVAPASSREARLSLPAEHIVIQHVQAQ